MLQARDVSRLQNAVRLCECLYLYRSAFSGRTCSNYASVVLKMLFSPSSRDGFELPLQKGRKSANVQSGGYSFLYVFPSCPLEPERREVSLLGSIFVCQSRICRIHAGPHIKLMRLDDSLVQGSDDAAAQIAAKHAIFSPLYTRLYPGRVLVPRYIRGGEVWREHLVSICSRNVQMVHEGVASSV